MISLEAKVPPPLVMLGVGAAMWMAARATPVLTVALPGGAAMTAIVAVAGLAVEGTGAAAFVRAGTTVDPTRPSAASRLVTTGVYRFTRNPMYLGDLLLLLGWAAWLSNAAALLLTPLFVLYIDRFQISAEERAMEACFGESYVAYRERVRRWV